VLIRFQQNWFKWGWGTLHSEIHKHIKLIWNKKGLRHQWEESTAVRLDKNGDKTDCSNYRGISLRAYGMHEKWEQSVRGLSGKERVASGHSEDQGVDGRMVSEQISGRLSGSPWNYSYYISFFIHIITMYYSCWWHKHKAHFEKNYSVLLWTLHIAASVSLIHFNVLSLSTSAGDRYLHWLQKVFLSYSETFHCLTAIT
jgi:hypothetical protein